MRTRCISATTIALCFALAAILGNRVSAHAIDYLAASISPAGTFAGASGNLNITNPVTAGSTITFNLTFSIVSQGSTTDFPRLVTFGSTTESPSPANVVVTSGGSTTWSHQFTSPTSSFTDAITITAPATPGSYLVKIQPTSGTGGGTGLRPGGGVAISFTVGTSGSTAVNTTL